MAREKRRDVALVEVSRAGDILETEAQQADGGYRQKGLAMAAVVRGMG